MVSDMKPTTWASFFFDLHLLMFLVPYFCFKFATDAAVFVPIYAFFSVYFAGVMVCHRAQHEHVHVFVSVSVIRDLEEEHGHEHINVRISTGTATDRQTRMFAAMSVIRSEHGYEHAR